jgi:hypothetical protein
MHNSMQNMCMVYVVWYTLTGEYFGVRCQTAKTGETQNACFAVV